MFPAILVILALAGSAFSTGPTKCDPTLIKKIKAGWNGREPQNLINNAIANGKEIVVGTSAGYYADNIKSAFSYFVQEKSNPLTRVDIYTVTVAGILQDKYIHVKEEKGTTYDSSSKVRRFHIYQDDVGGVTAFYACSEAADAVSGTPAGIVKVRAFSYDKTSLSTAKTTLKNLGIDITKTLV